MACNFELIKQRVKEKEKLIFHHINQELATIKSDYLTELSQNYKEEKDGYENFDEYMEENADEYIEFAFSSYLNELIPQLCNITVSEWGSLSIKDIEVLTGEYLHYFKKKSNLGYI